MMVFFSLLFTAVIVGAAVAIAWAVWSLVVLLLAKRKIRWILIGFPVSIGLVAIAIAGSWYHVTRPGVVFEREFGFPPPPDTTVVNASAFALGDSGSAYLYFRTSPMTATRLMAGYVPDPGNFFTNVRPPAWFAPSPSPTTARFISNQPRKNSGSFASEYRRITYDPSTGEVWYFFQGID
jgi:hypothetical protein